MSGYEKEIRALEDAKKVVVTMDDGFPDEHRAEAERRLAAATARVERLKREADEAAVTYVTSEKEADIVWGGDLATGRKPGLWGGAVHMFSSVATFGYSQRTNEAAEARAEILEGINTGLQTVAILEGKMKQAMLAGDQGLDLGRALEKVRAKSVDEIKKEIAAPQPVRAHVRKIRSDDGQR